MKQEINVPFDQKSQPTNPYLHNSRKNKQILERIQNGQQNHSTVKDADLALKKKRQDDLGGSMDALGHHQTTSKKVNDKKFNNSRQFGIDAKSNKALNFSAVTDVREERHHTFDQQMNTSHLNQTESINDQLNIRDLSQNTKQIQKIHNIQNSQSGNLDYSQNQKNSSVVNNPLSNISTNPSTSQGIFRANGAEPKQIPQFISLKQKLSTCNMTQQQKQLLILNQKHIDQQDSKQNSNGFNAIRHEVQKPVTQFHTKKKFEKTKNIYNQFMSKQEMNVYADMGVKGQKSRLVAANNTTFVKSRNSNMSIKSNTSKTDAEIIMGTYGVNNHSQATNYSVSSHYQQKLQQANNKSNNSFNQSVKNNSSNNNTKTSFGVNKQSTSHQEIPKMEVRGSNPNGNPVGMTYQQQQQQQQQRMMNRSNHNKFFNSNFSKQSRNSTFNQNSKASHSQQNIQLSKHKQVNKIPKDKQFTSSKTNFGMEKSTITQMSFNNDTDSKDEKSSYQLPIKSSKKVSKKLDKAESLESQQRLNRMITNSDLNNTFDSHNMTLTQNFKIWNNKKSDMQNNPKSTININIKQDLKGKNSHGQFQNKFVPSTTIQQSIQLQRGPKPDSFKEDSSELPQIVMQQNKSESNMWNKRNYNLTSEKRPPKQEIKDKKNEIDSQASSKLTKFGNDNNMSISKSSIKQGPHEIFDSQMNIMGSLSNAASANDFQSQYIGTKSFGDQRHDSKEHNFSIKKIQTNSKVNERSLENSDFNRLNSNNSIDYNISDANHHSVDRKNKMQYYKKSVEHMASNPSNGEKQNYNGITLAPIHGMRENFGQGPGTANTTCNPARGIYKNQNPTDVVSTAALHYKLSSQQCNSEALNHHLSHSNLQQQYYNNFYDNNPQNNSQHRINYKASTFDDSFDYLFNPQFEKLDALDPKDDLSNLNQIPVIRSQKSQGTYRQNYNKYNNIIPNYQNKDTHSLSEMYDLKSQNIKTEVHSQINDINVNLKPNNSQKSEIGVDQSISHKKSETYNMMNNQPPVTQDRPHPFNGPKLHLFKKGQSKSSQMKSRKIKTSGEAQKIIDVNSQSNMVYSQCDANSSYLSYPQRQQLSEGGPAGYQKNVTDHQKNQKVSNTKNGHVNISEILRENRQNGVLQNNIQMKIDQLYNDNSRSQQHSQENISQSSFEMGQGTPFDKHGDLQPPLLDFDNNSRQNEMKTKASIEHEAMRSDFNKKNDLKMNQEFSEMIAFETHSQQCPSQLSTLQQNSKEESQKLNLPHVNYSNTAGFNVQESRLSSPYIIHHQNNNLNQTGQNSNNYSSNMQNTMNIKQDNTDSSMHNSMMTAQQENTSTRPNTTNKTGNHIYIVNSSENNKDQKNKVFKQQSSNFQHPKVGKNSKYPQVFKQNSNNQSKTNSILINGSSQIMMEGRDSHVTTDSHNNSNIFNQNAQQIIQQTETYNNKHSKSQTNKKLEPKQTGDFPSPSEIKQYNQELKQEQAGQPDEEEEDQSESDFRGSEMPSVGKSKDDTVHFPAGLKQGLGGNAINLNDLINNEKFKSLMNEQRGDLLFNHQGSDKPKQKYYTPQRQEPADPDRAKNIQSTGGATRSFKSRQGGLRPSKGSSVAPITHNSKRMSENLPQKRTYQYESQPHFDDQGLSIHESAKGSVSRYSDNAIRNISQNASQLPLIKQNSSMQAQQAHLSQNSDTVPSTKPVKAMPVKKAVPNKLSTIEAKSTTYNMSNQHTPHVYTPKQSKSATQMPVFEINQQLNDQSQLLFENQGQQQSKNGDQADAISVSSHRYKNSSKNEAKDGKDSLRETNQNNFHSVAQTPCFAETPYTTDQFKGYKITPEQVRVPAFQQTGFSRGRDDSAISRGRDESGASQTRDKLDQNSNASHSYADDNSHEPETAKKLKISKIKQ